jgi:hypothetical protein
MMIKSSAGEWQKRSPQQNKSFANLYSLISISTENENNPVPLDNFYVYEVVLENQVVGLHMKAWG